MEDVRLTPIGRVHSALTERGQAPHQGPPAGVTAVIELDPAHAQGLTGCRPGDWLWVLYYFDRADAPCLLVHPRGDRSRPLTGVFRTRAPSRPCPVGLTLVQLTALTGVRLTVRGLEALDGTPVLDIKPYVPAIDSPREDA
ncbi:MAG: tRNA (N6-threonylcarbamoyladenosine(37)-N6)-methyltransferase TrmO [Pseudomonadota bacterium]